jgi:hypothetical protein
MKRRVCPKNEDAAGLMSEEVTNMSGMQQAACEVKIFIYTMDVL